MIPFSAVYGLAVAIRNWFFDIGILRITQLRVPVISVGNITAGGTGKTPFVELVVRKLQARGRKPAVLSRGYGRTTRGYLLVAGADKETINSREGGDEPVELAQSLRGTAIAVCENRVEGAQRLLAETSADCIVLDDGFQHRYLHRDLNIVLLTAREILSGERLLPAGNRRERRSSLSRADVVVISKCKNTQNFEEAAKRLDGWDRHKLVGIRLVPASLRNALSVECVDRHSAQKTPVLAFCGVGDPDSFADSVAGYGCEIVSAKIYPDHHQYSPSDLKVLQEEFSKHSATMTITTRKDVVRLTTLGVKLEEFLKGVNLHVLEVVQEFLAGEEVIDTMLARIAQ